MLTASSCGRATMGWLHRPSSQSAREETRPDNTARRSVSADRQQQPHAGPSQPHTARIGRQEQLHTKWRLHAPWPFSAPAGHNVKTHSKHQAALRAAFRLTSIISSNSTSLELPKLPVWPCWTPVSPTVLCTPLSCEQAELRAEFRGITRCGLG
jgi:hypothetical protein